MGIGSTSKYNKQRYRIRPSRSIQPRLIRDNWEDILRFMATIKLGHCSASQLFQRLNSYSKDYPLYKALKEFGRISKSQFILGYYDVLQFRQRVQKQLNLVELSNKFHDAVFWARGKKFYIGTQEEQLKYTLCRSVIQNSIILWNYLYLSTKLLKISNKEERKDHFEEVSKGSVLSWKHINFTGEYDFTKHTGNKTPFNLKANY